MRARKKRAKSTTGKGKKLKNTKSAAKPKKLSAKELLLQKTDENIEAKKKIEKSREEKPASGGLPTAEEIKKKIEAFTKSRGKNGAKNKKTAAAIRSNDIKEFRDGLKKSATSIRAPKDAKGFVNTGIPGFDQLLEEGIPKNSSLLVAGGTGTGKTIFCLQLLANACKSGKKAIYISFEENEENLKKHMKGFGWEPEKWIKEKKLVIRRVSPYELSRSVEALLAKAKGELLIEFEGIPAIIPKGFNPDVIVVDSLTAVAAAFVEREDTYRIYIEQFFRLLEKMGTTSFLITETADTASTYSRSGVEEFLADGVIAMYHIRKENVRVRGIEIIKLRGVKHVEKLVPFDIMSDRGIVVYPDEEVFV